VKPVFNDGERSFTMRARRPAEPCRCDILFRPLNRRTSSRAPIAAAVAVRAGELRFRDTPELKVAHDPRDRALFLPGADCAKSLAPTPGRPAAPTIARCTAPASAICTGSTTRWRIEETLSVAHHATASGRARDVAERDFRLAADEARPMPSPEGQVRHAAARRTGQTGLTRLVGRMGAHIDHGQQAGR